MTFSRPSIGPVDVGGQIRGRPDQRGAAGVDAPRALSGTYVDSTDRDVRKIASQAESDNKRIGALLSGLGDIATTAFGALEKTADKNEWQGILADPALSQKLLTADPETRAIINTFRPNVREMAGQFSADAAAERYSITFSSKALTTPGLLGPWQNPDGTPETEDQWVKNKPQKLASLREQARKESGLANIDPRFLPGVIEKITRTEGAVSAVIAKRETEQVISKQTASFVEGASARVGDALNSLVARMAKPKDLQQAQRWSDANYNEFRGVYQRTIAEAASIGIPILEANGIFVKGVISRIQTIASSNSGLTADQARGLLNRIDQIFREKPQRVEDGKRVLGMDATSGPIADENGVVLANLGELAINAQGDTASAEVSKAVRIARAMLQEDNKSEGYNDIARLLVLQQSGDVAGLNQQVQKMITGLTNGSKVYEGMEPQILSAIEGAGKSLGRPTDMQTRETQSLADRLALMPKAEDRRALIQSAAGRIGPGGVAALMAQYGKADPNEDRTPRNLASSIIFAPSSDNVITPHRQSFLENIAIDQNLNQAQRDKVNADLSLKLTQATVGYIDAYQKANNGKSPDRKSIEDFAVKKELELQDAQWKDARTKTRSAENANDKAGRLFQTYLNNVEAGREDVKQFTPEIINEYRRMNPGAPGDFRAIRQWLIQSAGKVRGEKDGRKDQQVFPDPGLLIREAKERFRRKSGSGSSMPAPAPSWMRAMADPQQLSEMAYNAVASVLPAGAASAAAKDVSSGPKLSADLDFRMRSLLKGVNVPEQFIRETPNMGGVVVHPQNYTVLDGLRAGNRLTIDTPPVPQAAANVPMPLPATITPNHPIFIAIGIGEGTRQADGSRTADWNGHRDKANRKWNVGTISSQNRSAPRSPAAADAYYARMLQREYLRLAPVLQRLGLQRNTVGFNRVMYNALDLFIQAPAAYDGRGGFIEKLPDVVRRGATLEAIATARAKSYYDPNDPTRLLASPIYGQSMTSRYRGLFADQRKRAMTLEYQRRFN